MKTLRLLLVLSGLVSAVCLQAQGYWDFPQMVAVGEPSVATTIVLRPVKLEYRAPVSLPPIWVTQGSTVRLQLGDWANTGTRFVWYKSGSSVPLASVSGGILELKSVQASDMGSYSCAVTGGSAAPTSPSVGDAPATTLSESVTLVLSFTPRNDAITALSSLVRLNKEQPTVVLGLVVTRQGTGLPGALNEVLIRVVGPSLKKYGVSDPLARPKLKLFKPDGSEAEFNYVVRLPEDPTTLTSLQTRAGMLPLEAGTKDLIYDVALLPGVYALHLSSEDGGSGAALVEIYQVP